MQKSTHTSDGILQLDLTTDGSKEKGTGALIYAAKVKVLDTKTIDIESYGVDAIRLMGVRKL